MCNAYAMKVSPATLFDSFARFGIPLTFPHGAPNAEPTDKISPTDSALIVTGGDDGAAALTAARWGLPPTVPKRPLLINMRSEGRVFAAGRALVPASWFHEYTGTRYPKTKWTIAPVADDFITFAAVIRATEQGPRFSLLTVDAGPDIAPIHGRQPAVVTRDRWRAWLGLEDGAQSLGPSPAGSFEVFETAPT